MAKAILLADAIAWYDEDGIRHEADGRGTEVELPKDAFEQHKEAGNIAAPSSKGREVRGLPEAEAAPGE